MKVGLVHFGLSFIMPALINYLVICGTQTKHVAYLKGLGWKLKKGTYLKVNLVSDLGVIDN